jgi:hypothetical protein
VPKPKAFEVLETVPKRKFEMSDERGDTASFQKKSTLSCGLRILEQVPINENRSRSAFQGQDNGAVHGAADSAKEDHLFYKFYRNFNLTQATHSSSLGAGEVLKLKKLTMLAAGVMMLAACSQQPPSAATTGQPPSATVDLQEMQAAYIGSGSTGTGVLHYQGQNYPFTISGLGVGGVGVSSIDARGDVYNLSSVAQFAGSYAEGRYGFAFGTHSAGDLLLKNQTGVVMHLIAKRTGLMLSLGGSAIVITMNNGG